MTEKTALVVTADVNAEEMASVQECLGGVLPLLMGAGGKLVKRLKVDKGLHGTANGMVLVMDFDSSKAVTEMFESEAYAALVPVRDKGFAQMNIQLTHEM